MLTLPTKIPLENSGAEYFFICPPGYDNSNGDWTRPGWYFYIKNQMVGPYSIHEVNEIEKLVKEGISPGKSK